MLPRRVVALPYRCSRSPAPRGRSTRCKRASSRWTSRRRSACRSPATRRGISFWKLFSTLEVRDVLRALDDPALDPIHAKVLYLKKGSKRLVLITEDLIGADKRMREQLMQRLSRLGSPTRTSSFRHLRAAGPGTISLNWSGRSRPPTTTCTRFTDILNKIAKGVEKATETLRAGGLSAYAFTAVDLQKNRRDVRSRSIRLPTCC
jgi:hypothetical protein